MKTALKILGLALLLVLLTSCSKDENVKITKVTIEGEEFFVGVTTQCDFDLSIRYFID